MPDLVALWEAHCRHEFETRDVDATMATMVERPYVNHVPTMTGGVGHDQLKRFYKYHFIGGSRIRWGRRCNSGSARSGGRRPASSPSAPPRGGVPTFSAATCRTRSASTCSGNAGTR